MKKKETEFLTEEEAQAALRVPDRRTPIGYRPTKSPDRERKKFRRIPLNSGAWTAFRSFPLSKRAVSCKGMPHHVRLDPLRDQNPFYFRLDEIVNTFVGQPLSE